MTKPKNKAQKAFNAETRKNAPALAKAQGLLLKPIEGKVTGFDGSQLKATTPITVQAAANAYFDRKSDVELAKDKMVFALGRIEAEMKAANVVVCVVRSMGGESMTCRIKSSSKLEIKRLK